MPVYKYRSFKEAEEALWNFNPDENYYNRVKRFWNFAGRLKPAGCHKKGVCKFHSIAEANGFKE